MDLTEMERLISKHDEWLSVNKFDNVDETDKFPEKYTLWKVTQEEIDNLNSPIHTFKKLNF